MSVIEGYIPYTRTSAHDKMAIRIAAPDTHTAMQTVDDDEECPVLFGSGFVGKEQYSGLTRFLQMTIANYTIITLCSAELSQVTAKCASNLKWQN